MPVRSQIFYLIEKISDAHWISPCCPPTWRIASLALLYHFNNRICASDVKASLRQLDFRRRHLATRGYDIIEKHDRHGHVAIDAQLLNVLVDIAGTFVLVRLAHFNPPPKQV